MVIRQLRAADFRRVGQLAEIARAEGFAFPARLVTDFENGLIQLDQPGEFFLCAESGSSIIGVGGITPDPYVDKPGLGRVRHVYIHPQHRGKSVGRALVRELERRADRVYSRLTLRTDTAAGARFYEALGYRVVNDATATHSREVA